MYQCGGLIMNDDDYKLLNMWIKNTLEFINIQDSNQYWRGAHFMICGFEKQLQIWQQLQYQGDHNKDMIKEIKP
jgi:hypothetical protein